jgi:transposase InsO family protein
MTSGLFPKRRMKNYWERSKQAKRNEKAAKKRIELLKESRHNKMQAKGFFIDKLFTCIKSLDGNISEGHPQTYWFLSLEDARIRIESWCKDYNECRPHSSLGYKTQAEFASFSCVTNSLSG